MPKVKLNKAFRYWHNGCWPKDYGPGEVEVDDSVAKAAHDCGAVDGSFAASMGATAITGTPTAEELTAMTNDQLVSELEKRGVDVPAKAKKAELVALLLEHWADPVKA